MKAPHSHSVIASILLAALVGYAPAEEKPEPVLLQLGGQQFTRSDFLRYLEQVNPRMDFDKLPASEQRHWIDEYVQKKLFALRAREAKLDELPAVRARVEYFTDSVLAEAWQNRVLEQIAVPPDELEAYYRDHRESFKVPPRVLLEHLLYKSREKARQAQKRLLKGETFTGLAKGKTKDADLLYAERDWFTPELLTREVATTAFQLPAGGVSDVIASSSGYHVLRAEAVEPARYREFDSVRDEILHRLRQQKAASLNQQMIKETLSSENVRVCVDF